jgi:hypothetical protein
MNTDFALELSDIRLLQTLRLLEVATNDHPDRQTVKDVLAAIAATRDTIAKLRATPAICMMAAHSAA